MCWGTKEQMSGSSKKRYKADSVSEELEESGSKQTGKERTKA